MSSLVTLDYKSFQLPEGMAYANGSYYVGITLQALVMKMTPGGALSEYARLPSSGTDPLKKSHLISVVADSAGTIYATLSSSVPPDPAAPGGIYRITAGGGDAGADGGDGGAGSSAVLWASGAELISPNHIAFDADGSAFVTDNVQGKLFKIPPGGGLNSATVWSSAPELTGDLAACPIPPPPFLIGANQLLIDGSTIYVTNTDRGTVLKFTKQGDGSASMPTKVVPDCAIDGAKGLVKDPIVQGSLIVGNHFTNAIIRLDPTTGQMVTVYRGSPLDSPSTFVQTAADPATFYLTNSAFAEVLTNTGTPNPAIIKVVLTR